MISEKNKVDDKIQFYSNHNYGNKKFDQRTSYDLGLEEDGFTKSLEGKNSASFQGYEPTFPENVMNIKNSRSKGTKPWNNNSELLEPPMPVADHIKGHSMTRANKKSDYHYYPHEINELMPNQSKEYFEDERELDKKNFLNNGSPFQLPAKGENAF